MKGALWAGLVFLLGGLSGHAQVLQHSIVPSTTNPLITDDSPEDAHLVCVNPTARLRNKLVLFLPGTGSHPVDYSLFAQCAANLGYHHIGLEYPNEVSVGSICNSSPGEDDPDCHELARLEIITGFDYSPHVSVGVFDSITGRLSALLSYLASQFPGEGWEQYLESSELQWEKMVVCGHSQGGGHSLYLAKTTLIDRCITFSGIDWEVDESQPADWVSTPFQTPVDRIYFFAHLQEWDLATVTTPFVVELGIKRYGSHVIAETNAIPEFDETHFLLTDLDPARPANEGGLHHNTTVMDADLEFEPDGITPVLEGAWQYLLTHRTQPVRIAISDEEARIYFSPGQLQFSPDLKTWVPYPYPFTPSPLIIPRDSEAWTDRGYYRLDPTP